MEIYNNKQYHGHFDTLQQIWSDDSIMFPS